MSDNVQSINISTQNVEGPCEQKCSYNFKYPETNLTAKNNGIMINLKCDNSNIPSVVYNNEKYDVSNISIVSPSIHIFNGATINAEILIEHIPIKGGPHLVVCIPIIESSDSSISGNLITEIIQNVSSSAPSDGETTTLNLSEFTLNLIVPKKPFYTYTGTDNNNSMSNFIVFSNLDAIPLNSTTLTSLSQIIKPFPFPTLGEKLFYNAKGPNNVVSDGIYISCKPTGSSREETDVSYSKNQPVYDMSILKNPYALLFLQFILGCIIFIVIFLMLNYAFTLLTSGPIKLSGLKIPSIK